MKIEIERSGGFSGISETIRIDTEHLPKHIADNLEGHLSRARLSNRSSNPLKSRMADCYQYKISTQLGKKKQEILFNEFEIDQQLRTTVNYLFKKSKGHFIRSK